MHFLTGDENWFYGQYVRDRIRTERGENRTVASRKRLLTVSWNPHGFSAVTMLVPRASFNASSFSDGNLVPLVETFFPVGWNVERRKQTVDIHNAPSHG
jgi:hypothetical protein